MSEYILELKNITKLFPGVRALKNVSFNLKPGEIHALVGENGAGKSTLIKIITGAYEPTEGQLIFNNNAVTKNDPSKSLKKGITPIYQELNLFQAMSVLDNMFMGREIVRRGLDRKSVV